jgi:hypothetical protein
VTYISWVAPVWLRSTPKKFLAYRIAGWLAEYTELDVPTMGIAMPICAGYTSLRFRKIEKVATTDVQQRIFISSATAARSKRLMMRDAPYPAFGLRVASFFSGSC